MAKLTRKYKAALSAAADMGYPGMKALDDAPAVYEFLEDKNYFWDTKKGIWGQVGKPVKASSVLKVRVIAEGEKVEKIAAAIARFLEANSFEEISHSDPCKCRPPRHSESRIYLQFLSK